MTVAGRRAEADRGAAVDVAQAADRGRRPLGNESLALEEVQSLEVGYSGIIGGKTFLTVDYYTSENKNFISDLIGIGSTSLSPPRVNPNVAVWTGDMTVETTPVNPALMFPPGFTVGQAVRASVPDLSSDIVFGNSIVVTYTNFGAVDTQGVDLGLNHFFSDRWSLNFAYSWFDFEIQSAAAGLDQILVPNTPENKYAAGVTFDNNRFDAMLAYRWVDDFRWVVGPFQGDVESYSSVDLNANYGFGDHWKIGLNIANLLDDGHWQSFGGDILARRALGHVTFLW